MLDQLAELVNIDISEDSDQNMFIRLGHHLLVQSDTVNELRKKFAYIFTTGGIGPTHDDITAESISKVFNQKYQYHPEAYKILEEFYKNENFNEGRKKTIGAIRAKKREDF